MLRRSLKLIPRKIEQDFETYIQALKKKHLEELPTGASIIKMEVD